MFAKKFKTFCKEHFWKKKKQASAGRKLLENAEIVLRFLAAPDDPQPSPGESADEGPLLPSPFVHVGFVNFKTWTTFLHRLDFRTNCRAEPGRLKLQSYILTQGDLVDSDCQDVFFTDLHLFRSLLDLSLPYFVEMYTVLSQPAQGSVQSVMPQEDMFLGYVDVSLNADVFGTCIWRGGAEEIADIKRQAGIRSKEQKANQGNQGKKTKKKAGQQPSQPLESKDEAIDDFWLIDTEGPVGTGNTDTAAVSEEHVPPQAPQPSEFDLDLDSDFDGELDLDLDSNRGSNNSSRGSDSEVETHKPQSSDSEDDLGLSGLIEENHLNAVRQFNFDDIFFDPEQQQQQQEENQPANRSGSKSSSSSSSDSSSSSSSGSSDSDDSSGSSSSKKKKKPAISRAPAVTEIAMPIVGYGFLRYNSTSNFLRAHCQHPNHGKNCMRRRSVEPNASRPGQGRPIGLLICWLKSGGNYPSHKEHVAASAASYPHRLAARNWFHSLRNAAEFESKERPCEPAEGAEPRKIP